MILKNHNIYLDMYLNIDFLKSFMIKQKRLLKVYLGLVEVLGLNCFMLLKYSQVWEVV